MKSGVKHPHLKNNNEKVVTGENVPGVPTAQWPSALDTNLSREWPEALTEGSRSRGRVLAHFHRCPSLADYDGDGGDS